MDISEPFVFQVDSEVVKQCYGNQNNFLIEYSDNIEKEFCAVYFSSNDLYYPNNEDSFFKSIVKKNKFEWYNTRINNAQKHIFLRDVKKQWYLNGINPEKLATFIRRESVGYRLILVGSSAGGFMATIVGQMLNAECIYTFNGQFEILSLIKNPDSRIINPILYRNRNNEILLRYYDCKNYINKPETIFYFHSCHNSWDAQQLGHLGLIPINKILFKTSNHGIPFLKSNLSTVLNLSKHDLLKLTGKSFHPLNFSIKMVGLIKTLEGAFPILKFVLKKIYIFSIDKWNKL
jgi:hypothetical protein